MVRLFGYFCCALFLLITSLSCDSSEPPPTVPPPDIIKDTIIVSIESFTHRSVTLRIQSTVHGLQSSIKVLRSFNSTETIIAEFPLEVADTTITDDDNGIGLMLDTTYTYFAVRIDSLGEETDTSNIVMQKTLAPTSHDYTWQEYTFGDAGYPNTLYDVWGTDENNVWACGGVSINDTVNGILHWDGIEWKPISGAGGVAIFGFSESDIWTVGGAIFHFDGVEWKDLTNTDPVLHDNQSYTSLWGTSSSNLYLGNEWGKIIHWDGQKAEVIKSFDGTYITDISGNTNFGLYVVGSKNTTTGNNLLVFFDFINWKLVDDQSLLATFPKTINMIDKNLALLGGNNLFFNLGDTWNVIQLKNSGSISKIRGKNSNNIFSVGFFKEAFHFNGVDWYSYDELKAAHGVFNSVFVTNQKVFIVGEDETYTHGQIYIGTK